MAKTVLLSPKVSMRYGGKMHSIGMQFYAEADDAEDFVEGGMAERVSPVKSTKASRSATKSADSDAPDAGDPSGTTAVITV